MISLAAGLAAVLYCLGWWFLISFGTGVVWIALLETLRWLDRRGQKSVHPKGSPLVCIRGETPADAIRVLLEDVEDIAA